MNVAATIEDIRGQVAAARRGGKLIGLAPTMGGLHAGHLSLIDAARNECGFVVVSIFVNPTQFAPGEDLASYPRTAEADLAACRAHGVDAVFMPAADVMYGGDSAASVTVEALSHTLCGASRPTHFAGVCTIVAKLLNIVQPDRAYFGDKDFQQAAIIERMVRDLNFPVQVVRCPIVRQADGLALSTRNAYLSPDERAQAPALHRSLLLAEETIRRSHPPVAEVIAAMREYLEAAAPAGEIDYIQIVDPRTLADVESTDAAVLIALAVRFGCARLIDNTVVD